MFVFIEGESLPRIELDQIEFVQVRIKIKQPLTFKEAIVMLASNSKQISTVIVFENFFSVGCKDLELYEKRGLERIALGDGAMEIVNGASQQTRFMLSIDTKRSKVANMLPVIRATVLDPISFGIGELYEHNTLIVGDTPGSKALGYNTPFVGSGSGQWLLKGLEEHGIKENKLYWINAKNCKGVVAEQDFLDLLKPKQIICLGKNAFHWASNLIGDYHVILIPHPQFWLRFRSGEEYLLYKLLK